MVQYIFREIKLSVLKQCGENMLEFTRGDHSEQSINFLYIGMMISEVDLLETLDMLGQRLLSLEDSHHGFATQLRDNAKNKNPLVFADGKFIHPYGQVGKSYASPQPLWASDCVFVTIDVV